MVLQRQTTRARTSGPACWQLSGALKYLGFDSEVIAACAQVMRDDDASPDRVGVPDQAPTLRDDGGTDGHAVLWTESFRLLIDPAIVLSRHMRAVAQGDPVLSFPVLLPVPDRATLFGPAVLCSSSRPSLNIAWGLLPHRTQALTPTPGSDLEVALAYGKLALAHATLQIIQGLDGVLRHGTLAYPLLPDRGPPRRPQPATPLPSKPPAAFLRLSRTWTPGARDATASPAAPGTT